MKEEKSKVSIIMPNYNRAKLIDNAIESVFLQSYQNWELIVVDDGSTDNSVEVILGWCRADERINSHFYEENSGSPVRPRNMAIDMAKGEYVAFLDSDDQWTKDKLERQITFMESVKSFDDSVSDLSYHDMALNIPRRNKHFWSDISRPYDGYCFNHLLYKNFISSSSVIVHKDILFGLNKLQDESLKISHDWDLWLRIAHECSIDYLPSVLGRLNISGGVTSNRKLMRIESRRVVRRWRGYVPFCVYLICLSRYYLVEVYDWLRR